MKKCINKGNKGITKQLVVIDENPCYICKIVDLAAFVFPNKKRV